MDWRAEYRRILRCFFLMAILSMIGLRSVIGQSGSNPSIKSKSADHNRALSNEGIALANEDRLFFSEGSRSQKLKSISESLGWALPGGKPTIKFLLSQAASLVEQGNYQEAMAYFYLTHDLSLLLNDAAELANSYNGIGYVHSYQEQFREARRWYRKAMLIQEAHDLKRDLAISYNNFAEATYKAGKPDTALVWYHKARVVQESFGPGLGEINLATYLRNIGDVHYDQGQQEDALVWYHKVHKILKKFNQPYKLASCCRRIGQAYSLISKYKEALPWFNEARSFLEQQELNSPVAVEEIGMLYNDIGETSRLMGNYNSALDWLNKSRQIFEKIGSETRVAIVYGNIGMAFGQQGRFAEALDWLNKSRVIEEELNLEENLAITCNNIGEIYRLQGQFQQGLKYFDKARIILEQLGSEALIANTYNNIGTIYGDLGKLELAMLWCERARVISKRLGLRAELATTQSNIGYIHRNLGQYESALLWYDKARTIQEELALNIELSRTYNNIGDIYIRRKQYSQGLSWLKKATKVLQDLEEEIKLATIYNNIAEVYREKGDYSSALSWYEKGMNIQKRLNLKSDLARSQNNLGLLQLNQGDLDLSLSWLNKSKKIYESMDLEANLSTVYNNIAFVHRFQNQPREALKWYRKAIGIQEKLGIEVELSGFLSNIALVFNTLSEIDSTFHYAQRSIQISENLRQFNSGATNRQFFTGRSLTAVELGITSGYELQRHAAAFSFSEKAKARGLIDLLAERSVKSLKLPKQLAEEDDALQHQLKAVNQSLAEDISISRRKNLIRIRDSLYLAQKQFADRLRILVPAYTNLIYPNTVSKDDLQSILQIDETLVSFFVGQVNAYAFIITPGDFHMIDLGRSSQIIQLVSEFRREYLPERKKVDLKGDLLLEKKLQKRFFQLSTRLYQLLWKPLQATGLLTNRSIILVPDGPLHYLPFEMLIRDEKQRSYADYNYLIKDLELTYYPSATVMHFERIVQQPSGEWEMDFLGLAKSNFEDNQCFEGGSLDNLPYSQEEVSTIANYFSPDRCSVFLEQRANKSVLQALDLTQFRYLHLSTHGIIDEQNPQFSQLLLSPAGEQDGCLNTYQIFAMELDADLVTLSACRTGLGEIVRGEGMVGFTRALMFAGTPSIILSLWEVGDQSAQEFFVAYYRYLTQDKPAGKYVPLRRVQLQMIDNGQYADPFYWAPFIFMGSK